MAVLLDQFVETLSQSSLMTGGEVQAFLDGLGADEKPKTGEELAKLLVRRGKLTKFQAQCIYQGKTKGLVFDEYTVLDKIGQGGMGIVLKAQHRRMKRLVAAKMLPAAALKNEEAVKRFYREVEAAARLTHPNIVTAYDAREHAGTHYLVMEYVEGKDLAVLVGERGPLPVGQAVNCVIQTAKGLEYAHKQGIIHRDIKPSNLLLDREGTVKILDMGLARIFAGDGATGTDRLTGSGQVMGTCDYMAPEQAEDTRGADHRADIYSLGCTLYRLLTGEKPYQGDTMIQILLAHRAAEIPSACGVRPDIPEAVDDVCRKMMAKTPEARYQSMTEVLAALETCVAVKTPVPSPVADEPSSDGELTAFLQSLPKESVAAKQKAARVAEDTFKSHVEQDTSSNIWTKLVPADRRQMWTYAGIAGGAALLVVLLGVVFMLKTPEGTLMVEVDEPGAAVTARVELVPLPQSPPAGREGVAQIPPDKAPAPDTPSVREPPVRQQLSRWLGYGVSSPAEVKEVADYTNVVWKYGGSDPDGIVAAARETGLEVVLVFECDSGSEELKEEVIAAARRDPDVVAAVCWEMPYRRGHQPADVARFGRMLKESAPGVQLWCNLSPKGETQRLPLPAEVDALMVEGGIGHVTTPEEVKEKADEVLPERIEKAAGRPVFLIWWHGHGKKPQGLVPECQPGMVRMLGQVTESYGLKGLFLISYGTGSKGSLGIGTSPGMVSEVREIAKGWGVRRPPDRSEAAPPLAVAPFDKQQARRHQEAWAEYLGVPVEREVELGGGETLTMVLIPPGEFLMGSTEKEIRGLLQEADKRNLPRPYVARISREGPQHRVQITPAFYMGKYEVTVRQFRQLVDGTKYQANCERDGQGSQCLDTTTGQFQKRSDCTWRNPGIPQTDKHPVVSVDWNDAAAFCQWLSGQTGQTYRLPSEAEWEYACRAGTITRWFTGNTEDTLRDFANVTDESFKLQSPKAAAARWAVSWDDGFPFTAAVGQFQANALGLHDMHGNVWEWCQDQYDKDAYKRSVRTEVRDASPDSDRVVRGSSWLGGHSECSRSAYRSSGAPGGRCSHDLGFRLVCEIPTKPSETVVSNVAEAPPRIERLDELISDPGKTEGFAWVSSDGRTICWTVESGWSQATGHPEDSEVWEATRSSAQSDFEGPRKILDGRHAVLSDDCLQAVLVCDIADEFLLCSTVRASKEAVFAKPVFIPELKLINKPMSPWLSGNGCTLVVQQSKPSGITEFVVSTRDSSSGAWDSPQPLAMQPDARFTLPITWPQLSPNGLTLWFNHGGGPQPEIVRATRRSAQEPFGNYVFLQIDGQQLEGNAPRHIPATNELFFSKTASTETRIRKPWVVRNLEPGTPNIR